MKLIQFVPYLADIQACELLLHAYYAYFQSFTLSKNNGEIMLYQFKCPQIWLYRLSYSVLP